MSDTNENYLERAAASRKAAADEVLENVRQKHLTAAATWKALAHAKQKMDTVRAQRVAERSAAPSAIDRTRCVALEMSSGGHDGGR